MPPEPGADETRSQAAPSRARIVDLEWDDMAGDHLARHGVSAWEVIQVIGNRHVVHRNRRREGRMTLIGLTDGGRLLQIALDPTAVEGTWRLVTAFDAGSWARRQFEQHDH